MEECCTIGGVLKNGSSKERWNWRRLVKGYDDPKYRLIRKGENTVRD